VSLSQSVLYDVLLLKTLRVHSLETPSPVVLNHGGVKQFPGERELFHALHHGKFMSGNVSLPNVVFCNVAVHLHDTNFLQYSRRVFL